MTDPSIILVEKEENPPTFYALNNKKAAGEDSIAFMLTALSK